MDMSLKGQVKFWLIFFITCADRENSEYKHATVTAAVVYQVSEGWKADALGYESCLLLSCSPVI